MSARDTTLRWACQDVGLDPDAPLQIGGNYQPLVRDGSTVYLAGQVPRIGDTVVLTGRLGSPLNIEDGQRAARIATLRALVLLRQQLGSLDAVRAVLKLNVYVQSAPDFTAQSEVANGASDLLAQLFGASGTRTSIGVAQLPKNAAVEIDMIVSAP
jgi:enamine deaminase RidA (YjgF/YER057c/UK114 family)